MIKFYHEALGLKILGRFENHAGYDGVMLGLPDTSHHPEFIQYKYRSVLPEVTKEQLLVLYFGRPEEYRLVNDRLQSNGVNPVEPENPYWKDKSETYENPDGWRIVIFNGIFRS